MKGDLVAVLILGVIIGVVIGYPLGMLAVQSQGNSQETTLPSITTVTQTTQTWFYTSTSRTTMATSAVQLTSNATTTITTRTTVTTVSAQTCLVPGGVVSVSSARFPNSTIAIRIDDSEQFGNAYRAKTGQGLSYKSVPMYTGYIVVVGYSGAAVYFFDDGVVIYHAC